MRCTLICDGSSDRALIPIIEWSLRQSGVSADLESVRAEFYAVRPRPVGLAQRVQKAVELYECDILFVHRDSEGEEVRNRETEIIAATSDLNGNPPHVCVVPVRMLESWLLVSEEAIRSAAGNPSGEVPLSIPALRDLEDLANPKEVMFGLLKTASGRRGRKLKAFDVQRARTLVSQYMKNFQLLRMIPSYLKFETDLRSVVITNHFDTWT